ncbi:ABC transporter permease subunit [Dactylosporangium sp. CA-139066]|uniref:ABC transporter permease subunit n=1 Tax=Dactylosporangium sp. CA-139066 TaxID=3239930 RepID=UPI003D8E4F54
MIWLTWRQFRIQALVAAVALFAVAAYLLYLGVQIRHDYAADVVNCVPSDCATTRRLFSDRYEAPVALLGALLIAVPGFIGVFWGAPLVARELEAHTDRLVWNQSVTRRRWLAVKLAVLGAAAVAVTGVYSLLLTWNASRYDQWAGGRFGAMNFASRDVTPLGYALFAFTLGVVVGLLVRRTVASMAIVAGAFVVLQIVVPNVVRVHLMPPITTDVAFTADVMEHANGFGFNDTSARIIGYTMPGAWSMDPVSQIYNADGTPYNAKQARPCVTGDRAQDQDCMAKQHLHFQYTYQPGRRYWPFQWIELSAYTALSALLAAFGLWRVRRRVTLR